MPTHRKHILLLPWVSAFRCSGVKIRTGLPALPGQAIVYDALVAGGSDLVQDLNVWLAVHSVATSQNCEAPSHQGNFTSKSSLSTTDKPSIRNKKLVVVSEASTSTGILHT
jgi:hypothetical protein